MIVTSVLVCRVTAVPLTVSSPVNWLFVSETLERSHCSSFQWGFQQFIERKVTMYFFFLTWAQDPQIALLSTGAASRAVSQVHHVFCVYCQSALMKKTGVTFNKKMAVGIRPDCGLLEAWCKHMRDKVIHSHSVKYLTQKEAKKKKHANMHTLYIVHMCIWGNADSQKKPVAPLWHISWHCIAHSTFTTDNGAGHP